MQGGIVDDLVVLTSGATHFGVPVDAGVDLSFFGIIYVGSWGVETKFFGYEECFVESFQVLAYKCDFGCLL